MRNALALLCAVGTLGLGACTTTVAARPDYVTAGYAAPVIKGKATLVMSDEGRRQIITEHPNSLTGGGTQIAIPIGAIVQLAGEKVLGAAVSDGVLTQPQAAPGAYAFTVSVQSFTYKYDQLSSLGFAVTPKVTVSLAATIVDPAGRKLLDGKTYTRHDYSATGAYFATLHPQEKINQSAHQAVADLFREMVDDAAKAIASSGPTS